MPLSANKFSSPRAEGRFAFFDGMCPDFSFWDADLRGSGGGGQDRTADLQVMKTPISNTINYLHAVQVRQNTPKYE